MADARYQRDQPEARQELNAREARQGWRGRPVLIILIASLLIALVALVGLMSWQRSEMPDQRPIIEQRNQPVTPPAR